nr:MULTISPECIES: NUDIX domain-containing protein [unclassified Collinsella]
MHQAFLTLLVEGRGEDARLLLCRRSPLKRLWGGVLADSCAGHPLPGEDVAAATARRINEELGITREPDQLEHLGHVVYREAPSIRAALQM